MLPPDLADSILKALDKTPALLLGLSLHLWDHRELFRNVFRTRPLPDGSLVVVEPKSPEVALWRKSTGLPAGSRVQVVEATSPDLTHALEAAAQAKRSEEEAKKRAETARMSAEEATKAKDKQKADAETYQQDLSALEGRVEKASLAELAKIQAEVRAKRIVPPPAPPPVGIGDVIPPLPGE